MACARRRILFVATPMGSNANRRARTVARWQACADAGMSQAAAARHLGTTRAAACLAARRYGVAFRADPRAPMRQRSDPVPPLTDRQRRDYETLLEAGFRKADALGMVLHT